MHRDQGAGTGGHLPTENLPNPTLQAASGRLMGRTFETMPKAAWEISINTAVPFLEALSCQFTRARQNRAALFHPKLRTWEYSTSKPHPFVQPLLLCAYSGRSRTNTTISMPSVYFTDKTLSFCGLSDLAIPYSHEHLQTLCVPFQQLALPGGPAARGWDVGSDDVDCRHMAAGSTPGSTGKFG